MTSPLSRRGRFLLRSAEAIPGNDYRVTFRLYGDSNSCEDAQIAIGGMRVQ